MRPVRTEASVLIFRVAFCATASQLGSKVNSVTLTLTNATTHIHCTRARRSQPASTLQAATLATVVRDSSAHTALQPPTTALQTRVQMRASAPLWQTRSSAAALRTLLEVLARKTLMNALMETSALLETEPA